MSLISLISRCAPKRVSEERASTAVFQNNAQIVICAEGGFVMFQFLPRLP